MVNLKNVNPAIADSLKKSESVEDVIAVFKAEADGMELSQADAEEIWKSIQRWKVREQKADQPKKAPENLAVESSELSLDELEAVSGGADFLHHGCESTVEYGSSCFCESDACSFVYHYYGYKPVEMKCPVCNEVGADSMDWPDIAICKKCHRTYNYVTGEYNPMHVWVNF